MVASPATINSRHFGTHEAGQISPDIDLVLFPDLTGPLRGKPLQYPLSSPWLLNSQSAEFRFWP
jgi:hypothetical protein